MKPPATSEPERALFFCGRLMQVPFIVRTWVQHGMHYRGHYRSETTLVVNHATGAENAPHQVFESLRARTPPLSIHFVVDPEGKIFQFADTELRCSHTGTDENARSIGIEFVSRGHDFSVPKKGVARLRKTVRIHGRMVPFDALTPAQVKSGVDLNEALCGLYGLPFRVPKNSAGKLWSGTLATLDALRFTGCVEHLHLKSTKNDCYLEMMAAIDQRAKERSGLLG